MFDDESARWIAAADGGADAPLLLLGDILSLRMGDVVREVRGLVPVKGEARRARLLDDEVRKTGAAPASGFEVGIGCDCG
jgi:hypothetical protein